jgi:iron-sulfur cluster repair protein YtfE (RIC family)
MSPPIPAPMPAPIPAGAAEDAVAAQMVVRHHRELATGLDERVQALLHLVEDEYLIRAELARVSLLAFLRQELIAHARAEEQMLYPAAAARPGGAALVDGMVREHRAIVELVGELTGAPSLVRAAGAARALAALFAVHLAKENDLVVPMLVDGPAVPAR